MAKRRRDPVPLPPAASGGYEFEVVGLGSPTYFAEPPAVKARGGLIPSGEGEGSVVRPAPPIGRHAGLSDFGYRELDMVETISVSLRVWDRLGRPVYPFEFVDRLNIVPDDSATVTVGPGCSRVQLLSVVTGDFSYIDTSNDAGARSEAMAKTVQDGLVTAAAWLDRQPREVFDELRASGRTTDVSVSGWITDDQFDLELPPEFLQACGRLGLSVSICTND